MAVGLDVVEKTLRDLEKEITCAVCQEHYTDPKILPCLHCYCKQCILKLSLNVGKGKPFPCPECRKDTVLPDEKDEDLKSAFIINRLKSMYLKHKKALSKKVSCEICTNTEALAEAFCHQCDKFTCKNCVQMHSVMTAIFNGHVCVPIEQLQNIQSQEFVRKHSEPINCNHHQKKLKLFCFDCNKLICRDCTVKDHRDHSFEFNNLAADNKKKELMEALKPLREVEKSLSQALTKVAETESDIQNQEETATNQIKTSFTEFHKILDLREKQLLKEVSMATKQKISKLTVQKKYLSIARGEVHNVIDHTEQCVRLCSDDEVMSMHSEVASRIQTQIRECSEFEADLQISEKADITVVVNTGEVLQQFCHDNAYIKTAALAEKIKLEKMPSMVEVDTKVKLVISNKSDEMISVNNIKCQFRCISTGAVSAAKIEERKGSKYEITYVPTQRGHYSLEISAYGHPVSGSPIFMTAYSSPTTLNKPMKIWKNAVCDPSSIAINSHDEVVVVERNKAISIFNKEGNKIRTASVKSLLVDSLHSATTADHEKIYFIGHTSNMLGKCDCYFNNIHVKEVQRCGYGIAVVEDAVLVTEMNKGQIAVYDRDLNFVRHISAGSKTTLRHLCPDSHENLYVSTSDNRIIVLNINGDILRSFSQDQYGVHVLKNPWMVHVYGSYVYVADNNLEKTVVFTTEGQYVTTFGHFGPLSVDKDGVVYNCNTFNNYIYMY